MDARCRVCHFCGGDACYLPTAIGADGELWKGEGPFFTFCMACYMYMPYLYVQASNEMADDPLQYMLDGLRKIRGPKQIDIPKMLVLCSESLEAIDALAAQLVATSIAAGVIAQEIEDMCKKNP